MAAKSWRRERWREIEQTRRSPRPAVVCARRCVIRCAKSRRSLGEVEHWIEIRGARANNLKNVDVRFPVGRLSRHHRHFRFRKIDAHARSASAGGARRAERKKNARTTASCSSSLPACRDTRSGLRSRSIADRQDLALDAGDLHQGLRRDPQSLRADAGLARARLFARAGFPSIPKAAAAKPARARA